MAKKRTKRPTKKLGKAITCMRSEKVVVCQNAGYTQSDGHYSCNSRRGSAYGYAFYHQQALERAMEDGDLVWHHGQSAGRRIAKCGRKAGLKVNWNGRSDQTVIYRKAFR